MNTLREAGCKISFPNKSNNYKYILSYHPFCLHFKEDELNTRYPNTYKYLLDFKEELQQRKDSRKFYAQENWYRHLRPGSIDYVRPEKILFKGIDTIGKAGLLDKNSIFNGANCPGIILVNNELNKLYLLGVLNSDLVTNYLNSICPKKLGGYFRYNSSNLAKIPIVKGSEEEVRELENIVIKLTITENEILNLKSKFHKRIQSSLGLEKVTKKLEEFYSLTFKEFLQELEKQKIKLSLADQDEWDEYFSTYVSKIREYKIDNKTLNNKLNYVVNKIYNIESDNKD